MRPSITHIIPVHNGARYLREALDSLLPELSPDDRIIVSDDGSTDDSVALAEVWGHAVIPGRFLVLRSPQGGVAAARNRALAQATGDWICLLDADDLALPNRIALLGARLLAPDRPDLVYGAQRRFVSPELLPAGLPPPTETDDSPAPLAGCLLAWKATFDRIGPFDETLRAGEFLFWLARGQSLGLRSESVPALAIRRRRHDSNVSGQGDYRKLMLQALRRSLSQRR